MHVEGATRAASECGHHEVYLRLRGMMQQGDSARVAREAAGIAEATRSPLVAAQALAFQLGAMSNVGDLSGFAAAADRAFDLIGEEEEPTVLGELHALSAEHAAAQGAWERCLRHLEHSRRALEQSQDWVGAADAWHDLALTHSKLGLHRQAIPALERAERIYAAVGLPNELCGAEIRVRQALAVDHGGDTATAGALLRKVLHRCRSLYSEDGSPPWSVDRAYVAYAAARLAVLGETLPDEVAMVNELGVDLPERAVQAYVPACLALVDGDADGALELLREAEDPARAFGASEPARLRSLAHAAAGRLSDALEAQREASAAQTAERERFVERCLDGVAARIDQERLRALAASHAAAAYTDALTGLPNRRRLHEYAAAVADSGREAVLGVLDVNDFKSVNDAHGHLAGDLVLQRVAAVIASAVRRDDFVARYGGDEFVVILLESDVAVGRRLGRRIRRLLSEEDWTGVLAADALDMAAGWAPLTAAGFGKAFAQADRSMYRMKARSAAARERRN